MSDIIAPIKTNSSYPAARLQPQQLPGEGTNGGLSRSEAEYYSHCDRSVLEQKYAGLRGDVDEAPPGTQQYSFLQQATKDLWKIGLARGIFAPGVPNGPLDAQGLKRDFEATARKYLTATDENLKRKYADDLYGLDNLAAQFGVGGAELDSILAQVCKETNCDLTGKDKIESMAGLSAVDIKNVGPDGLPREVKEILVKTGYWQLVKDNINLIVLVRSLPADHTGFKPGGMANPVLRRVEVDFFGKKKVDPPWSIALTLVHEAAHIAWRSQPALLQNLTPDERQAYATELEFLGAYSKQYGIPENNKAFIFERLKIEAAVMTANQLLGYAPDNFSVHETTLPSSALDLSYYPAKPNPSFLAEKNDFDNFAAKICPALDRPTAALLWDVLDGRANLTVSAKVTDGSVTIRPKITLHRLVGKLELTPRQVEQLAELFNQLPLSGQDYGRYNALVFSGSRPIVKPNKLAGDFRISYASLRNKLYEASIAVKVEAATK